MTSRVKSPVLAVENPLSIACENYRTLRTNIEFLHSVDHTLSSFVLTSSVPGAGKSLTAANLAVTIGQSEASVVLIDADLRNPRQHHLFGIDNAMGLTNAISRGDDIDQYLVDGPEGIKILPAGLIPPNPADLLDSRAAEEVFGGLHQRFQMVVVDAPPLLPFADPLILGRYVGAAIYVVRAGFNSRRSDLKAMDMLSRSGIHVAGVVLNASSPERARGYGGYYYKR